jgi:hypothetical protein
MARARDWGRVIQCDTDGYWIAHDHPLPSSEWTERVGQVSVTCRVDRTADAIRCWGPRHYYDSTSGYTLAGIPHDFSDRQGVPSTYQRRDVCPEVVADDLSHDMRSRQVPIVLRDTWERVILADRTTRPWRIRPNGRGE